MKQPGHLYFDEFASHSSQTGGFVGAPSPWLSILEGGAGILLGFSGKRVLNNYDIVDKQVKY